MTDPHTPESADDHTEGNSATPHQSVLGPVAAKGPKRFAAIPDLSQLPASARERMRSFVDADSQWGASTTDARSLFSPAELSPESTAPPSPAQYPDNEQVHETHEEHIDESHVSAPESLYEQANAALKRLVGRDDSSLREDQWKAIHSLVEERRRTLVVQRTGWGKSAVYFVATALLREQGDGPTVIISPLLALMRDQIAAAHRAGIKAVTINSSNVTQWDEIHQQILAGDIDVLLCSPERLNNPQFRETVLPKLAQEAGLIVVDEAHCISDWGHDFRPDYRRIRTLLHELPTGIPVLATTATANERVSVDIAEQLAGHDTQEVVVLKGSLERDSLHLSVVKLADDTHHIPWLIDAMNNLPGSGIIYCLTVSAAHEVSEQLRNAGIDAAPYTGQTEPAEREELEQALKNNALKVLVATSALGMGFDKPDLTFVIHYGAPNSPIAYYQQVGRAGRGVAQATVVLLPTRDDERIWEYFGSLAFPSPEQVSAVLHVLTTAAEQGQSPVSIPALEAHVDLKRSRLEMMLKVLDVDGAVTRVSGGWEATGNPWTYDAERYERVARARAAEQQSMLQYVSFTGCRVQYLRKQLDDPFLPTDYRCGRCDNCGGVSLPDVVSHEALAAAQKSASRPGIAIPARKMWPTGMSALGVTLSGRIAADEMAEEGRAVARIDALGWSNMLRELFDSRTPDAETPLPVRTAVAQVLDAWPEMAHVEGIVGIRSDSRPLLNQHLAQGVSRYMKKPFIGTIGPLSSGGVQRHDINSALRLDAVLSRLRLELSEPALNGLPGRTILLVDDYCDSGWTYTVASRLLKQAGAATVYPFVLAQY
ncbi:RecQ family ATP-dependent DNA helicase [Timonella sp. A28]|uniref:RecQ family ATP-dependent DNA helicase n=1 Tax=Timonella sp. A28 TaxID=3442640 RepID=UPI003EC1094B